MNRPAVLRQLENRVTRKMTLAYRVRSPDVEAIVNYVRELEGRVKVRPAPLVKLDADDRVLEAAEAAHVQPEGPEPERVDGETVEDHHRRIGLRK